MDYYTIFNPDGSFAMRITRLQAGRYRIHADLTPLAVDDFFASLRMFYIIGIPSNEGHMSTFTLDLRTIGYTYERDHLKESLASIYDAALSIHQGKYYFKPRTTSEDYSQKLF